MSKQSKILLSFALPPILPVAMIGWLIQIDGPTANNIAIAVVWAYFEIKRRQDMKRVDTIAEAKAAPVAAATRRLEAKVDANAALIDGMASPTINVNIDPKGGARDGQEAR